MTDDNAAGVVVNDLTVTGHIFLRRLVLLGTPLALAVLEFLHPQPMGVGESVEQGGWFKTFYFIQLPLIGLMVLAVAWLELTPRVITGAGQNDRTRRHAKAARGAQCKRREEVSRRKDPSRKQQRSARIPQTHEIKEV
jgi:hypothetical protein